jgi:hypothetical protein
MDEGAGACSGQGADEIAQQGYRGAKRSRDLPEADEDDVCVEVTTGEGRTHNFTLPPKTTVLTLKQHMAHDAGFNPEHTRIFMHDDLWEDELEEEGVLGSLRQGKGMRVLLKSDQNKSVRIVYHD